MNMQKRAEGRQHGANRARVRRPGTAGLTPANSAGNEANEPRGFDPYNSGTFDRRNNWARIGKR